MSYRHILDANNHKTQVSSEFAIDTRLVLIFLPPSPQPVVFQTLYHLARQQLKATSPPHADQSPFLQAPSNKSALALSELPDHPVPRPCASKRELDSCLV